MAGRRRTTRRLVRRSGFARSSAYTRALARNPWTRNSSEAAQRPRRRRRRSTWGLRERAWYAGRPKRRFRGRAFTTARENAAYSRRSKRRSSRRSSYRQSPRGDGYWSVGKGWVTGGFIGDGWHDSIPAGYRRSKLYRHMLTRIKG